LEGPSPARLFPTICQWRLEARIFAKAEGRKLKPMEFDELAVPVDGIYGHGKVDGIS